MLKVQGHVGQTSGWCSVDLNFGGEGLLLWRWLDIKAMDMSSLKRQPNPYVFVPKFMGVKIIVSTLKV